MSHQLISLNSDLKKLRDEGYRLEIKNGHLLVYDIPYVNPKKEIGIGVLVCSLDLAGEKTVSPTSHTIYFKGDVPCDKDGNPIKGIINNSNKQIIAEIEVDHYFSAKPLSGKYKDYYEKITTYVIILESHAKCINELITARNFMVIELSDPETPFNYLDTNSSRAEIDSITNKMKNLKIAIIGLGGTGSYILDFVSKTPAKEIHIFDKDDFFSHNAFRSPGAASIDILNSKPKKVSYLFSLYSKMHKNIIPHDYNLESGEELLGMNFVFICIDDGGSKKNIIEKLLEARIPFIDVGIGIDISEKGSLFGSVRTTLGSVEKNDHISKRISFSDNKDDIYNKNIQIAELNALNASLAVIKWKKYFGFYCDLNKEHFTAYNIDTNSLINEDNIT